MYARKDLHKYAILHKKNIYIFEKYSMNQKKVIFTNIGAIKFKVL